MTCDHRVDFDCDSGVPRKMKPKKASTVLIPVAVMVRGRRGGAGGGEPRKHLFCCSQVLETGVPSYPVGVVQLH